MSDNFKIRGTTFNCTILPEELDYHSPELMKEVFDSFKKDVIIEDEFVEVTEELIEKVLNLHRTEEKS